MPGPAEPGGAADALRCGASVLLFPLRAHIPARSLREQSIRALAEYVAKNAEAAERAVRDNVRRLEGSYFSLHNQPDAERVEGTSVIMSRHALLGAGSASARALAVLARALTPSQ